MEVIKKPKHGFGLPFGIWLQSHNRLRSTAANLLATLKERHVVKGAFVDELSSARVSAHPSYYGNMVWVLVMLEQWLKTRNLSVA